MKRCEHFNLIDDQIMLFLPLKLKTSCQVWVELLTDELFFPLDLMTSYEAWEWSLTDETHFRAFSRT